VSKSGEDSFDQGNFPPLSHPAEEGKMKRTGFVIAALGFLFFAQTAWADWTPAKRLTWTTADTHSPALAVDSGDGLHVVWHDNTAGNNEVYYRRSTNGGTSWGSVKRLTWNSGNSQGVSIAVDAGDAIHVVWYDATPGRFQVYYRKSPDTGITWGATRQLADTTGVSYTPAIAADPDGTLHIVWSDNTPGNKEIYHMRSLNGGATWSAAKRLTWTSGESAYSAMDATNGVHVVWGDDTPGNHEIYYRRTTDGGITWGAVKRLTWTSDPAFYPAVAVDSGSAIHVTWSESPGALSEILYKRSTNGGVTWNAVKRLTWTSGYSRGPAVAVDANDDVHIVWDDDTPGNKEVYYRQSPAGGTTWGAVKRLTWTAGDSSSAAMAVDSSHTIHIVWHDDTPGNFEIYYKRGT
jgi:hypothetical protein